MKMNTFLCSLRGLLKRYSQNLDSSKYIFSYFVYLYAGTVVKRKRGKLLADLVQPGDEVLVARGGQGGVRTKS